MKLQWLNPSQCGGPADLSWWKYRQQFRSLECSPSRSPVQVPELEPQNPI